MKTWTIIIALIGIILSVFTIWAIVTFKNNKQKESEATYYELKYKIQFLVAMFISFSGIAALLGYNSYEDAVDRIENSLKERIDNELGERLTRTELRIESVDSLIATAELAISERDSTIKILKYQSNSIQKIASTIEQKINAINQKNILRQNYYVVSDLPLPESYSWREYPFSDLITTTGQKLPTFESTPLVLLVPDNYLLMEVMNTTKESFKIGITGDWIMGAEAAPKVPQIDRDSIKISVVIFEK